MEFKGPFRLLVLVATVLLLVGCGKNIQNNDAVRKGLMTHLSKNAGLQLDSLDIELSNVTFRDKEADVVASFRPKGGDAASGMQMRYTLEQKGNEWVVKSRADSGSGMGHGALPPASGGALPPGHPPTTSGAAPGAKQ